MRIISANLNGIRSAANKGFFDWLPDQRADVVCVQELKAQAADMAPQMLAPDGYQGYFHYAGKKGYSGVGLYSKKKPDQVIEGIGVAEFDAEGRYVRADFGKLSVVSVYVPSGSSSPERQAAKFRFMAEFFPHPTALFASGREIILCGDWNIAQLEIQPEEFRLPAGGARLADAGFRRGGLHGRVPQAVPGRHRRGLYLVEQPRPGLGQERGLAHRLPCRHARNRKAGEKRDRKSVV